MMEGVDLIIYINLNTRTDRREEMEREFRRLEIPDDKILRWEAIRMAKHGALGCTLSHIAVMEYIMTLPDTVQTIMVLEDDFDFAENIDTVKNSLKRFLEYPRDKWDMVMLSYYVMERADYDSLVSVTLMAQRTSGYMLNRRAVPDFLANFREGSEKLANNGKNWLHAIDVYWWKVMSNRRCFYFNEPLGHQRKSYSNVTNTIVSMRSVVEIANPRIIKHHKE